MRTGKGIIMRSDIDRGLSSSLYRISPLHYCRVLLLFFCKLLGADPPRKRGVVDGSVALGNDGSENGVFSSVGLHVNICYIIRIC